MGKLVVVNSISLDGVMQAPGRPDEDERGGFPHGGWAREYNDEVMGRVMGQHMATSSGGMLLGRRTYQALYDFWPKQTDGNPYTEVLNRRQKYVVSRTLTEPLPWQNSTLIKADDVEALKRDQNLAVLGSGELLRTLTSRDLVDEYLLLIHPLLLGTGQRLFGEAGTLSALRLVDSVTTTKGVIIATYQPA